MSNTSGATTRTYNPNVRVGNWNEELCLEEDILKNFLGKQESGTLLIQRTQSLMQTLLAKTELSEDKNVKFGDNIMLVNPGRNGLEPTGDKQLANLPRKLLSGRNCSAISVNIDEWPAGGLETLKNSNMTLTGAKNTNSACVRNTFKVVKSVNHNSENFQKDDPNCLVYGEKFALKSTFGDGHYIFADKIRIGQSTASKNGVSALQLVPCGENEFPYGICWVIESFDPLLRMEHEGLPVSKNEPLVIRHCATGQHLSVFEDNRTRTPFGLEMSLGARTYSNSHKAEMDNNYWIFK